MDVGVKGVLEEIEVERGDVCICDEDVCVGWEGREKRAGDVRVEVESAVDGVSAKDGDRSREHCERHLASERICIRI